MFSGLTCNAKKGVNNLSCSSVLLALVQLIRINNIFKKYLDLFFLTEKVKDDLFPILHRERESPLRFRCSDSTFRVH